MLNKMQLRTHGRVSLNGRQISDGTFFSTACMERYRRTLASHTLSCFARTVVCDADP